MAAKIKTTEKKTPLARKTVAVKPAAKKVAKIKVVPAVKNEATVSVSAVSKAPVKMGKTVNIDVYDVKGKVIDSIAVPAQMFQASVNTMLVAQAVRVYLANQRSGSASTKSRGEVAGSTRKIYRQKGTGRARHGGIRAPIFVGGGIAFGPKPQDHSLKMPKKMKRQALFSALSQKMSTKTVKIVSGMQKITPKTKEVAMIFANLSLDSRNGSILFVPSNEAGTVSRAARNLSGVTLLRPYQVNTYELTRNSTVVLMKEALDEMITHFLREE